MTSPTIATRMPRPRPDVGFFHAYVLPALLVFFVPTLAFLGFSCIQKTLDDEFLEYIKGRLERGQIPGVDCTDKRKVIQFATSNPASSILKRNDQEVLAYKALFDSHEKDSFLILSISVYLVHFLIVLNYSVLFAFFIPAFISRKILTVNYIVLLIQWNILKVFALVQVTGQAILTIGFIYLVTAVYFHRYAPQFLVVAGMFTGLPILLVGRAIFQSWGGPPRVNGLALGYSQAPALWDRIGRIAAEMNAPLPKNLVLGLENDIFVSEGPLFVQLKELKGATLVISLPMLRVLSRRHVDALIFHQFSYLAGGDTSYQRKVEPLLDRYWDLLVNLRKDLLARPVYHFLYCFWQIYWRSFDEFRKSREARADRVAAEKGGAAEFAIALQLSTAFKQYWELLIERVMNQNELQEPQEFLEDLRHGYWHYLEHTTNSIAAMGQPANGESKPANGESKYEDSLGDAIAVRLRAVGLEAMPVFRTDYFETKPGETWLSSIPQADELESGIWQNYSDRITQNHENRLAYRYLPANARETEIVEKCFPPMIYENQGGREMVLKYDSVCFPDRKGEFRFDEIEFIETQVKRKIHYLRIKTIAPEEKIERVQVDNYHADWKDIVKEIGRYLDRHREARHQSEEIGERPCRGETSKSSEESQLADDSIGENDSSKPAD